MPVYGEQGKAIFNEHLNSGKPLDDIQFNNINLEEFALKEQKISNMSCRRSVFDNSNFSNISFYDSLFEESNLKDALFQNSEMNDVNFNSSILLRARFLKTAFYGGSFKRSYMQRVCFDSCSFRDTLFLNVEGARTEIKKSVFVNCDFLFDDSGGITGFQDSKFTDSIFINCTFQGFALTAVNLENSVFIGSGFALPDWEDINTDKTRFSFCNGIPEWKRLPQPEQISLKSEIEAARFLAGIRGEI